MDSQIDRFITHLARTELDGPVINPYASGAADPLLSAANRIRRQNLKCYLKAMVACQPWLLLVGEAPGYRGCGLTGVPFTSEAIILDQDIWPFGDKAGFRKTPENGNVVGEATATLIWRALRSWRPPALLWNAFPFHPYWPGRPASNRKPNARELSLGAAFLVDLLDMFQPRVVAAVGRTAAHTLGRVGLDQYVQLRHPSHGGKAAFMAGLNQIRDLADS
jgi:hypothetical protein